MTENKYIEVAQHFTNHDDEQVKYKKMMMKKMMMTKKNRVSRIPLPL